MPDGPEIDLEALKKTISDTIPTKAKLNKIEEKPIAFGLKALEVQIILNDREGGAEEIEKSLNEIKNVLKPLLWDGEVKILGKAHDETREIRLDSSKIRNKLKWEPKVKFFEGLIRTADWIDNYLYMRESL